MNHTGINLFKVASDKLAQGYNETGEATTPWDLASLKGSGAISSTLNDMILYTLAQMGMKNPLEKAISLTHHLTLESKEQSMGLAWRISHSGERTYMHHSGGTGGFRSFVGFNLLSQVGIVILSNAADDITSMGELFLKHY